RGHDHLCRQLPRADRDHANRRVLRARDRSRRGDRAEPGAAVRLGRGAGLPPRPLAARRFRPMTPPDGDGLIVDARQSLLVDAQARRGLVVDAEVRRGDFTLTVSLAAAPGQVLGVLGPNGAGKSTLLSAVAGLTPVAAGRILLAGQVMDDAATGAFVEASGRPVGFVFQNYRLFPHLTVADNVAFSPRARRMGKRAARAAAGHWLGRLGLTGLAGRKPGELSGGQAQRVALARA